MEGTAATFLKKLLTDTDPNFVDIRSPVGSELDKSATDMTALFSRAMKDAWSTAWAMTFSKSDTSITPLGKRRPITQPSEPLPQHPIWTFSHNAKVVGTRRIVASDPYTTTCRWAIYSVNGR